LFRTQTEKSFQCERETTKGVNSEKTTTDGWKIFKEQNVFEEAKKSII